MKVRFKKPTSVSIFARHKGPYLLLVVQQGPRDVEPRSRWSKIPYIRGEDVDTAARAWFEEEATMQVAVWTESDKYFVTTYQRRDVDV